MSKNRKIKQNIFLILFIYIFISNHDVSFGASKTKKHVKVKKKVSVTAYTICKKECGKSDGKTAYNGKAIPWKTAAVGDDLKKYKKRHVYIPKLKRTFYINDRKKKGYKGIDVCVRTKKEAIEIGNEITEAVFF